VDRSIGGYEGLIAAQECLRTDDIRDDFAAHYSVVNKLWEAISPDVMLGPFETTTSGFPRFTSPFSRPAVTAH